MDLMKTDCQEVDATSSTFRPMVGFDVSGVKTSGTSTIPQHFLAQLPVHFIKITSSDVQLIVYTNIT
jgi:hypothetical protein